jgi:branched-chain amino acid transport system ATP-binding protein
VTHSPDLVCTKIDVEYGNVKALRQLSCTIPAGMTVGLIGPNGSGKTTLLNVVSGLLAPTRGTVRLGGRLSGLPRDVVARRGVFRSFQNGRLFDSLTGEENVAAAYRPPLDESLMTSLSTGVRADPNTVVRQSFIAASLDSVGAGEERRRPAAEMSFGMRKRTILAQAIVSNPVVCLLDEPLAGTDLPTRTLMLAAINQFRSQNAIVLWVEHDLETMKSVVDRIIVLDHGQIAADGDPATILASDIVRNIYFRPQ